MPDVEKAKARQEANQRRISKRKLKIRRSILVFYLISLIGAGLYYYVIDWSYRTPPTPLSSLPMTLEWQNNNLPTLSCGDCSKFLYYSIPFDMTFYNRTITQNQRVTMFSTDVGSISKNLTIGLWYASLDFQNVRLFNATGAEFGTGIGLTYHARNQTAPIAIGPALALVPDQNPIELEWQSSGTDYPTVRLAYYNGTVFQRDFTTKSVTIQSESIPTDEIIGDMNFHKEFGALLTFGIVALLDGAIEVTYKTKIFPFGNEG